ncbi:hypothetical protein H8S17_02955 [Roseburia sp. BX1005]|uniref:Uncharacterized protein n=1 Tax=Roseburia zhanii TaxID=2763064 RepID=A0A923LMW5_9FIRM|nr:hypothetical protein [Roseburia zhanii]MBC5713175.1 hypothetical protein [Roseburia zhanii]
MILFSIILKTNASLTKDAFVKLVLEWNRTSKYKENCVPDINWNGVPDINWNGEYNIKYGNDRLSLEFVDYPDKQIMAVRHEKVTGDAVIWDTDYVINFEKQQIAIRLDRTYKEEALVMNGKFSTPHFITLLIEGRYLADDYNLPVLRSPIFISDEQSVVIADVVEHTEKYQLPVIYVSKTSDDKEVVDTDWLASRLKGAAHILVEKDKENCRMCSNICKETKEEFGAVRIYFPAESMSRKRFLYRSANGDSNIRLEKIITNVIQYWNAQSMDILYTWQGVNNAVLNLNLDRQIAKYQEAESARQSAKKEVDQVYNEFDEDLKKMQQKLEELTRTNETLMIENSVMRAKMNSTKALPILYQGNEEDFYPDEIQDMILSILEEAFSNTESKTRRADILSDIIENNQYQHLSEKRKQKVKAIFKGYKNLSGAIKQELMELGITISEDGKHYKLTYNNDPRYMVTVGKTPSNNRAGNNNAALINKIMM